MNGQHFIPPHQLVLSGDFSSYSSLKCTVKVNTASRPAARLGPPDLEGGVRGGSRPPCSTRPLSVSRPVPTRPSAGGSGRLSHPAFERQPTGTDYDWTKKSRTGRKWLKPNIRVIYYTYSCTIVDFLNFSDFLLKTFKIYNFVNNGLIFTGIVLNDVFHCVLQLSFCIKLDSS